MYAVKEPAVIIWMVAMNVFVKMAMKKFNPLQRANVKILMNVLEYRILVVRILCVSIRMAITNVRAKMVSLKMVHSVVNHHVIRLNVVNMQPVMLMVKKLHVFVIQDSLSIRIILAPDVWISMNV
ncbi:hypothetical protein BLA29_014125, partial [Euroglyphus maynei]